ncbi:transmembrane protein [Acinetobacter calcoaceticus]|uniref:Transmembrane protein n=1 Tax=Acinetobacter calcoaceticus TaxID=471 RepID=A0A4R1XKB4_ACICA|nr:transmembrane protein [Acinetobacter calcoaceticus]
MPRYIQSLLRSPKLWLAVRCMIALLFVYSGLEKVLDVEGSFAEMRAAGLNPAWLFNYASALVLLGGSYFILFDKAIWLGAGILSIFLVLTIVVVHSFWNMSGLHAIIALYFALEHVAVIGGLMAVAMTSHYRQLLKQYETGAMLG